jgi:hypothetical protein
MRRFLGGFVVDYRAKGWLLVLKGTFFCWEQEKGCFVGVGVVVYGVL